MTENPYLDRGLGWLQRVANAKEAELRNYIGLHERKDRWSDEMKRDLGLMYSALDNWSARVKACEERLRFSDDVPISSD